MLLEFTVGNYLSFKEKKTLSLEATAIKDNPENVFEIGKYKVLRSAVIYGANSSGKSNLIKAFETMGKFVKTSQKNNSIDEIDVTPFLLSTVTEHEPSYFEILFLIDGIRYRYGFEADRKTIHSEWLFESKGNKEKQLFIREKDAIEITDDFEEGKKLEDKTRDNGLFLSVVDQFNGIISRRIMAWFENQNVFSGLKHEEKKILTSVILEDVDYSFIIRDFLLYLNLGIDDFKIVESTDKKKNVVTFHNKYDEQGNFIGTQEFDLLKQESSGTNKLYDIAGRLTHALNSGGILVIDELDAKLHPLLTTAIVKLFNSFVHNAHNAQLIFATHDTNLLSQDCFRRDQIYFTEKNNFEATDLYSLVEYRELDGGKVRNDRSYEKDYITGRYGAIPFVGDFSKLTGDGAGSKD